MTDLVLFHHAQGLTPGLFLYPGDRHLFADDSLPDYDASATALLVQRVLAFLDRAGR